MSYPPCIHWWQFKKKRDWNEHRARFMSALDDYQNAVRRLTDDRS